MRIHGLAATLLRVYDDIHDRSLRHAESSSIKPGTGELGSDSRFAACLMQLDDDTPFPRATALRSHDAEVCERWSGNDGAIPYNELV